MKRFSLFAGICSCILALTVSAGAGVTAKISGDYLETRSADVFTGPCIANSEAGLAGNQAIVAWYIKEGAWDGIRLDGLSVVGVARANSTLGDPYSDPYPAKAVLIVDSQASMEQRTALQAFAQSMAKDLLKHVVKVEVRPIRMEIGEGDKHGCAVLDAGDLAKIETRCIGEKDHLCGNEEVYYQPLTELSHAMAVYTMNDEFAGKGLGLQWKLKDMRSAFVGTFSRDAAVAVK